MHFLVIGLGSMGKRRIRCLQALGFKDVAGVDARPDRRSEAAEKYGIAVYPRYEEAAIARRPDAVIISVPPDVHHIYMAAAVAARLPFFVEASVVDNGILETDAECKRLKLLAAPSATLLFHPGIQLVAQFVRSGALGRISNVIHHSGQFLSDWHTYEHVRDYYVSNPATGGAREIVPFELSWLTAVFGFPRRVAGTCRKTISIEGAEKIDDTYDCIFDYGDQLIVLVVDVVSRCAVRRLTINGDKKQLVWDWDEGVVRLFDPAKGTWERHRYDQGAAAEGYNANIGEIMYREELRSFLEAAQGRGAFPNTLANDHANLRLLYAVEQSDRTGRFVDFAQ